MTILAFIIGALTGAGTVILGALIVGGDEDYDE